MSTGFSRVNSNPTFKSLSISRVLVKISSVLKVRISSGRSSHVSSAGASGVSSIATPSVDDRVAGADGSDFLFESDGGVVGGGAEDIVEVERAILLEADALCHLRDTRT